MPRVFRFDVGGELADGERRLSRLVRALPRQCVPDVDRRDRRVLRDEAPREQWLGESDALQLRPFLCALASFQVDQVIDQQVVFLGL